MPPICELFLQVPGKALSSNRTQKALMAHHKLNWIKLLQALAIVNFVDSWCSIQWCLFLLTLHTNLPCQVVFTSLQSIGCSHF